MADERDEDLNRTADALAGMGGADKRSRPARHRPEAPNMPGWEPIARGDDADSAAELLDHVVEDDDYIDVVPEADASSRRVASVSPPAKKASTLYLQRTLIPVLLTCGVLLMFTGGMKWLAGAESPFGTFSTPLSLIMLLGGGLILLVGVLNVLYVRAMLAMPPSPAMRPNR